MQHSNGFEGKRVVILGGSSGIGLAVVRKTVQRLGGTAGVESELGNGSRFWVELRSAERVTVSKA